MGRLADSLAAAAKEAERLDENLQGTAATALLLNRTLAVPTRSSGAGGGSGHSRSIPAGMGGGVTRRGELGGNGPGRPVSDDIYAILRKLLNISGHGGELAMRAEKG